jgi:hypothetical protein
MRVTAAVLYQRECTPQPTHRAFRFCSRIRGEISPFQACECLPLYSNSSSTPPRPTAHSATTGADLISTHSVPGSCPLPLTARLKRSHLRDHAHCLSRPGRGSCPLPLTVRQIHGHAHCLSRPGRGPTTLWATPNTSSGAHSPALEPSKAPEDTIEHPKRDKEKAQHPQSHWRPPIRYQLICSGLAPPTTLNYQAARVFVPRASKRGAGSENRGSSFFVADTLA